MSENPLTAWHILAGILVAVVLGVIVGHILYWWED